MALNPFFTQGNRSEQGLVQELIDEHIKMHGIEFTYMPRIYVNTKTIIKEVSSSKFDKAFPIEGYIENYQGFGDNHNILTKFGVRSTAEMTVVISQGRFEEYITPLLTGGVTGLSNDPVRPLEGDLLYFPLADMLFEIKYVEHEQPSFYQLQKNYTYQLKCELFEYEDEQIDTGIGSIDDDFETIGYNATMQLLGIGTQSEATATIVNGSLSQINLIDGGTGYTRAPNIVIQPPNWGIGHTATAVAITTQMSDGKYSVIDIQLTDTGSGYSTSGLAPRIQFISDDGEGDGAQAVGSVTNGSVGKITMTEHGSDYVLTPVVTFSSPPSPGVTAEGFANLDADGKVGSISIVNAGSGYASSPTVTVSAAGTIGVGTYFSGDVITGSLSSNKAFVTNWNNPTMTLTIKSLSGHFTPGEIIVGTSKTTGESVAYRLNTINYDDDDVIDNNQEFEVAGEEILDWGENNPFSERP
tara:strand:+ start:17243 stop:18649 length:1407 start_codon:yes stop_codon:yes gene_type:complete